MKIQTYPDLRVQQLEWNINSFSYEFMEVSNYMVPLQKRISDQYMEWYISIGDMPVWI